MDKDYAQYLLNKTKTDYNLIAEDFSRTRSKAWEELNFLFSNTKERVLDLGCGNGRYYELLNQTDYTGVDFSEKLIGLARKKYPEADFRTADSLNLLFGDNSFDKVYSIAVFHHIPSKELRIQFLKETQRILRPKGKLVLTVWKFHNKETHLLLLKYTILKIIGKSKLDFKDILEPWADKTERYYHWFSKRELSKIVRKTGFKIQEIGVIKNKIGNRQNIYLVAEK